MNCLVWYCRGLGNPRTVRELGKIIRAKDPSVVFVAETWTDEVRLDQILRNIDFDNKWVVLREGRGGGLALFWKSSVNLVVEDSSNYYIDTWIDKNKECEWRFIGFYSEPKTSRRGEAWDSLRSLNHHPNVPWLCVGDFNELTRQDEKLGGAIQNHGQMQSFQNMLDECGFIDLGFVGPRFTWSKHFSDGHSIWERLDRDLANNNWFHMFPGSRVHHPQCFVSDHCPLLINMSGLDPFPTKKFFCFKEMWLSDERCTKIVEATWSHHEFGINDSNILRRVKSCGKELAWWNRNIFGNVRRELEKKRAMLTQAESATRILGSNHRV